MSERYPGGFITKDTPVTTQNSATGVWTLEQAMQATRGGNWPTNGPFYIEDVFSTWLYTGTGSTQTINNGIDLAGKGGLTWIKQRTLTRNHNLFDTARGATQSIFSDSTSGQLTGNTTLTSFNSNGFSLGNDSSEFGVNLSGQTYASWTFREQPKFFDVVTWTGNGALATRYLSHSLGSVPGCIMVKRTDTTSNWVVIHRGTSFPLILNSTAAASGTNRDNGYPDLTYTDATQFAVSDGASGVSAVNASGGTYVAYLFAHNAGGFGLTGTDNVISCGSFTTDGGGNATVNLGYEPQWVMMKASSDTSNWFMVDNMRGMTANNSAINLFANTSGAETSTGAVNAQPLATGFSCTAGTAIDTTYVYVAIRRGPMRTPTAATAVFQPVTYTGTNVDNRLVNTGIVTDMTMARIRTATSAGSFYTADRLRGNASLGTAITSSENTDADSFMTPTLGFGNSFSAMNGFGVGNDATRQLNQSSTAQLAYAFRRAPGFFDEVCYTGTGVTRTVAHNLTVAPELMIVKRRSGAGEWYVYSNAQPQPYGLILNSPAAADSYGVWASTAPTSSVFTVSNNTDVNESGGTFVAYLFASCPGVSRVGSYTGTGATQVINCGFTAGARFVLIKGTNTTANWYVWDSARGIVAGNDPYLVLDSTSAEVTNTDWVDTATSGFELSDAVGSNANSNGVSYIFLAIA